MSLVRGSSILSENPHNKSTKMSPNVVLDLLGSTFFTVIGYVCLDIVFAISLHFISVHNDPNAVAGLGLAFTTVNVLLIPMALGTNQSLNVHSAQALGANRPKLSQTFFNMTILLHLLYFLPIAAVILALKYPISLMIEEKDREATSNACQTYLYFLLPSSLFAILYEAVKSYMIAHKIFSVFMFIQVFTAGLHILWCYLFIDYLDLGGGIAGAGLAIIVTEVLNCTFCILVIVCSKYKDQVFENYNLSLSIRKHKKIFKSFARSSFPIIAHIYADYFVFFLLNFIAVTFGSSQLNAQLALSNTSNVYYKFPISLSMALMTYIGNEMGARNIKRAKVYAWVGVLFFVLFTSVFLTLLTVFKLQWAAFYAADNEDIMQLILDVYPIFTFGFFIIDGLQGTLTGILKGIERKELVTYSTLLVYYVIGIPLVLFYSCKWGNFGLGLKVYGIWFAFMLINGVLTLLYLWVAFATNWEKQSELICMRVDKQDKLQVLEDSLNKDLLVEADNEEQNQKNTRTVKSKVQETDLTQSSRSQKNKSNSQTSQLRENKQIVKEQQGLRTGKGSIGNGQSLQNQSPFVEDTGSFQSKHSQAVPVKKRRSTKDSQ